MFCYAEYHYALDGVMLNAILLSAVTLNVVAPFHARGKLQPCTQILDLVVSDI